VSLILKEARRYGRPILDARNESQALVHAAAVLALQKLDTQSGVAALAETLRQGDTVARGYALHALAQEPLPLEDWIELKVGGRKLVAGRIIRSKNARLAVPALLHLLRDAEEDFGYRREALHLAAQLAPESPDVRQQLREMLDDADLRFAFMAALTLADIDPEADGLVPALFRLARTENTEFRHDPENPEWRVFSSDHRGLAANALARVAPEADGLVPLLIELIQQMDPNVTCPTTLGAPIAGLKRLGPKAAPAVPVLLELLEFSQTSAGGWLFHQTYTERRGFPSGLVGRRVEAFRGEDSIIRWIVKTLGAIGPAAGTPEVIEALQKLREFKPTRGSVSPFDEVEGYLRPSIDHTLRQIQEGKK
jgi:HEAT repeat protein